MTLEFIDDTSAATWLLPGTPDRAATEAVLGFGPSGFQAYARVLQLPDPQFDGQPESDVADELIDHMPDDVELIGRTVGALLSHSSPPEVLHFLLWEGYPYRPALPDTSRFDFLGLRGYALATGAIDDWTDWVAAQDEVYGPGFVWPASRDWCIAFDVDSHFAGVGAADEAIARLLEIEGLTAERAAYGVPTTTYG